jgi:uncharacterized membrane protein YvbJ
VCPHCGAVLRPEATYCRECGASPDSGWGDDEPAYESASDDEFDYDEFLRREFPESAPRQPIRARHMIVWCIVILAIASICAALIGSG